MATAARRCASVPVVTIWGPTEMFGGDNHGQVLLKLYYAWKTEYEPAVPADVRGKYYYRLVPESVVLTEREAT